MRFFTLFFFFFVTFVTSFDFDFDSKNDVDVQSIVETTATLPPTTNTTPATLLTTTNTTKTTTTTLTPEKPLGREVSEVVAKKEDKIQAQQIELTPPTTKTTATATLTTTSGLSETKLEVVVTRSMFRLIDEAFRERLINFESRIASLLSEREKIRDDIQQFNPAFDASFFDEAFTAAVKTR